MASRGQDLQEVAIATLSRARFPRQKRLRSAGDFRRLQSAGVRVRTPHFILIVGRGSGRLGLVVSRKSGNAPQRNRIKRLIRECFRTWPDLLEKSIDLVVISLGPAPGLDLAKIREEWSRVQPALQKSMSRALAQPAEATHVRPRKRT